MKNLKTCITFDLDFTNYIDGGIPIDEFRLVFPSILSVLSKKPESRATWFIRLDAQIEALYGEADYFFHCYKSEIDELRSIGHEIGWHPHCYAECDGVWKQNTDVSSVLGELSRFALLALDHGIRSVRMGWGFHTNETMHLLSALGFVVDSSAIPRPRHPWEQTEKDWTVTPCAPYFPSRLDYRIPGDPALSILEVPMSVIHVKAPYDSGRILRCLNLAYRPDLLRSPLEQWLLKNSDLIPVTHPYELFPIRESDGLLAFNLEAFEQNFLSIYELSGKEGTFISFCTISEFAKIYGGGKNAKP